MVAGCCCFASASCCCNCGVEGGGAGCGGRSASGCCSSNCCGGGGGGGAGMGLLSCCWVPACSCWRDLLWLPLRREPLPSPRGPRDRPSPASRSRSRSPVRGEDQASVYVEKDQLRALWRATCFAILDAEATATFALLPASGKPMMTDPYSWACLLLAEAPGQHGQSQ